jgi:hypothetical protein
MKTSKIFFYVVVYVLIQTSAFANAHFYLESKEAQIKYEKSLESILELLPREFVNYLPVKIEIQLSHKLSKDVLVTSACQSDKKVVFGEYNRKSKESVLALLASDKTKEIKLNCNHKTMDRLLKAIIIHEIAHLYDDALNISSASEFIEIANFKFGLFKLKSKNKDSIRVPDSYETKNIREFFAVNFEYYILDKDFECKRPTIAKFFNNLLKIENKTNCSKKIPLIISTNFKMELKEIDFDQVLRIDYLIASKGKGISSGFGHSMLRLVICKDSLNIDKCLNERLGHLVVSFRANVNDLEMNPLKGLFGHYPSELFVLNYSDVIDEYTKNEFRDLKAYPLKLSKIEKNNILQRIAELHWSYRGPYKFITNNCATETLDLISSGIDEDRDEKLSALTPNGVLKDLIRENIIDQNIAVDLVQSKHDLLIKAMENSYKKNNLNKKKLIRFLEMSKPNDRLIEFKVLLPIGENDNEYSHQKVSELKEMLKISSGFSVIEQQILSIKNLNLKEKIGKFYLDNKNSEIAKKINFMLNQIKLDEIYKESNDYGIPNFFDFSKYNESIKNRDLNLLYEFEELLKAEFKDEYTEIDQVKINIETFNKMSIDLYKRSKESIEHYVRGTLLNMTKSDHDLVILIKAKNGEHSAIEDLRKRLDPSIVNEREFKDEKIIKMLIELFSK